MNPLANQFLVCLSNAQASIDLNIGLSMACVSEFLIILYHYICFSHSVPESKLVRLRGQVPADLRWHFNKPLRLYAVWPMSLIKYTSKKGGDVSVEKRIMHRAFLLNFARVKVTYGTALTPNE